MPASNRAALIAKLQTALKKHYKPAPAQPTRPLLEHVLYGSLLEDAPSDLADEGMAKCEQEFFDWNEVRVTTVTELAQVLSRLPDPVKAAHRMKSNLQGIFEEFYTFDLDHLKKENLGKAVNKFEKMSGMTPFVLSYTIQHGLGGHSIPIDYSAMVILLSTEIASQPEAATGKVPGLERAIPKNKGIEFSGLLHQAAVDLNKNTKDTHARAMLDAVCKGSSKRLDEWLASRKAAKKRAIKRKIEEKAAAAKAALEAAKSPPVKKKVKPVSKKKAPVKPPLPPKPGEVPAKKSAKVSQSKEKPARKTSAAPSKKTTTKQTAKKPPRKTTPIKKSGPAKKKSPGKKSKNKAAPVKKKKATSKKTAATKRTSKSKTTKKSAKKSTSRKLSKRKPR
jgi:endonuclease-3